MLSFAEAYDPLWVAYTNDKSNNHDDNFAPYGRGGRHTGSGPPEGCEGSSMKGDVFFSGKVRFAKEQWHVSYVFTNIKTATGSIEDKWVGIKFIVYNFVENNKVVVKTELWLDTSNNGNFVKVDENVDRDGWGYRRYSLRRCTRPNHKLGRADYYI
jgi:hypothetical protein